MKNFVRILLSVIITSFVFSGMAHAAPGVRLATYGGINFFTFFQDSNANIGVDASALHSRINDSYIPSPADNFNYIRGKTFFGNDTVVIDASGNMGIGDITPGYTLDVAGTGSFYGLRISSGATNSFVLTSDATGNARWAAAPYWGVTGGQANYVTRWLSATSVGTGSIYDNGTNVGIGTTSPHASLSVAGAGDDTLAGIDNVMVYNSSGTPRIQWEDAGYKRWIADNSAGSLRFILMPATNGAALAVPLVLDSSGNINAAGTITAATPTASNQVTTKAYVDAAVGAVTSAKSQTVVITSGAGTWTVPTGVTGVEVILVGAGGGGGSCACCSQGYGGGGSVGGNTTFGSITAYGGGGGGTGGDYYTNSSGNGGNGGGTGGGVGQGDNYYGCDANALTLINGKAGFTRFGGGAGTSECNGTVGYSYFAPKFQSFSSSYGAGGAKVGCGGSGGGGEVVQMTIPVSGSVSYSVGSAGAGATAGYGYGAGGAGAGGYIQINYIN